MKALSIKQPYASLIAHGIKNIENRTWKTKFRGRIYIHASGKKVKSEDFGLMISDEMYIDYSKKLKNKGITERTADFLYSQSISAIIGEVDIIDCIINHESIWAEKTAFREEDDFIDEKDERNYYKNVLPNIKPIYNWVLANPVLYEKPILNVKGKLSFWEPNIDVLPSGVFKANKNFFDEFGNKIIP